MKEFMRFEEPNQPVEEEASTRSVGETPRDTPEKEAVVESGAGEFAEVFPEQLGEEYITQTKELNTAAERFQAEEIADKVVSENPSLIKRFGRNVAMRIVVAGMLAFGVGRAELAAGEPIPLQEGTPQYELVTNHLGLDAEAIQEKFNVEIPVDNGSEGKYILHIGQKHSDPQEGFVGMKSRRSVVDIQKDIEKLILRLKAKGADSFFRSAQQWRRISFA